MALGGCYTCIKYLMFAFNFLFWLVGCAILGIGIWLRVDTNLSDMLAAHVNVLYVISYVFIGVGGLIMIVGFLGCCGAVRESQCMLTSFFILLFIIFAILLTVGILAVVKKDEISKEFTKGLQQLVRDYHNNTGAVDALQTTFKCCGATQGRKDYPSNNVPESCGDAATQVKDCNTTIGEALKSYSIVIAGVAIGIGVIMLIGMTFAMLLCCAIRESSD